MLTELLSEIKFCLFQCQKNLRALPRTMLNNPWLTWIIFIDDYWCNAVFAQEADQISHTISEIINMPTVSLTILQRFGYFLMLRRFITE